MQRGGEPRRVAHQKNIVVNQTGKHPGRGNAAAPFQNGAAFKSFAAQKIRQHLFHVRSSVSGFFAHRTDHADVGAFGIPGKNPGVAGLIFGRKIRKKHNPNAGRKRTEIAGQPHLMRRQALLDILACKPVKPGRHRRGAAGVQNPVVRFLHPRQVRRGHPRIFMQAHAELLRLTGKVPLPDPAIEHPQGLMPAQGKAVLAAAFQNKPFHGMQQSPPRSGHDSQRIKNAFAADDALPDFSFFKQVHFDVFADRRQRSVETAGTGADDRHLHDLRPPGFLNFFRRWRIASSGWERSIRGPAQRITS
ncbi:MAG: hypothetical protein BWX68_03071 [Verrucomicrobia bacterium ADurb.Bin063]|nr:MAG: hypothetical protein BWX68_03071 [Verrucomicrobia bacterium ADurb.Bin063]